MWDFSSLTRDWTCTPDIERKSLNHWTIREVSGPIIDYEGNVETCWKNGNYHFCHCGLKSAKWDYWSQTHFTRLQLPMAEIFQAGIWKFFCFQLGFSSKIIHLQCRRHEFNSWGRKISQRRKWQPTPVFLPGKSPGQRSLTGYSPWGHKKSNMT